MANTFITIQLPESLKNKSAKKAKKDGYKLAHFVRIAMQEKLDRDK